MPFGQKTNASNRTSSPGADPRLDAPYGGAVADGFGGRGETAAAGPAAEVPETRLAAPPAIDFGEVVAGEHPTEARYVFNLNPGYQAHLSASLAGSPEFVIVSAPDRLRPSREGLGTPIVLMYQPTKRAVSRATLTISASWQMGVWPRTTIEIPVTARAYAQGERSHAEEEATAAAAATARAKARDDRHQEAWLEERTIVDNRITEPYPQGAMNDFDAAFEDAKGALALITDEQANGVAMANEEATAFRRRVRHHDPGLLFSMAMFGIDAATAGIVGSLAARLGARVSQKVRVPPRPEAVGDALIWNGSREAALNPPEAVALVVEAFKTGFKDAGKAARKSGFAADHGGGAAGADSGARIEFFADQRSELARSKAARGHALVDAMRHLRPLLRTDPDEATAAMRAFREALEALVGEARDEQAMQSRVAWMRFLSQNALGSLDADDARVLGLRPGAQGETITDIRGAIAPPREHEKLEDLDGVLDLEFVADYAHPEEPVQVKRARMSGVHLKMLDKLKARSARSLGIVIRAHGTAPGLAVLPITVVRDEAGNVRFTDDTAAPGQESSWLTRKGGWLHTSPERQRLGAIKLMDDLIDRPLVQIGALEADHDGT